MTPSSRSTWFLLGLQRRRRMAWLMLAAWLLALGVGLANACVDHPAGRAEHAQWSDWSDWSSEAACPACRKLCTDEPQALSRAGNQGIDTTAHAVAIANAAWRRLDVLPAHALQHVTSALAPPGRALSAAIRFQRLNL